MRRTASLENTSAELAGAEIRGGRLIPRAGHVAMSANSLMSERLARDPDRTEARRPIWGGGEAQTGSTDAQSSGIAAPSDKTDKVYEMRAVSLRKVVIKRFWLVKCSENQRHIAKQQFVESGVPYYVQ